MLPDMRSDQVRDIARLHEETVRNAHDHLAACPRAAETRPRSTRAETLVKVHPLVMAQALKLAGGDASRLQIISDTEVRVR
jgi:hypothetical protein